MQNMQMRLTFGALGAGDGADDAGALLALICGRQLLADHIAPAVFGERFLYQAIQGGGGVMHEVQQRLLQPFWDLRCITV